MTPTATNAGAHDAAPSGRSASATVAVAAATTANTDAWTATPRLHAASHSPRDTTWRTTRAPPTYSSGARSSAWTKNTTRAAIAASIGRNDGSAASGRQFDASSTTPNCVNSSQTTDSTTVDPTPVMPSTRRWRANGIAARSIDGVVTASEACVPSIRSRVTRRRALSGVLAVTIGGDRIRGRPFSRSGTPHAPSIPPPRPVALSRPAGGTLVFGMIRRTALLEGLALWSTT